MSNPIDQKFKEAFPRQKFRFEPTDWTSFENEYLKKGRRRYFWIWFAGLGLILLGGLYGDNQLRSAQMPTPYSLGSIKNASVQSSEQKPGDEKADESLTQDNISPLNESLSPSGSMESVSIPVDPDPGSELRFQPPAELPTSPNTISHQLKADDVQVRKLAVLGERTELGPIEKDMAISLKDMPYVDSVELDIDSRNSLLGSLYDPLKFRGHWWEFSVFTSGYLAPSSDVSPANSNAFGYSSLSYGLLASYHKRGFSLESGMVRRVEKSAHIAERLFSRLESTFEIIEHQNIAGIDSVVSSHEVGLVHENGANYYRIIKTNYDYDTMFVAVFDTVEIVEEQDTTVRGRVDLEARYIELPLLVNYRWIKGRAGLEVTGGLIANIRTGFTNRADPDFRALYKQSPGIPNFFQAIGGVSAVYFVNNHWNIRLSGLYRKNLLGPASEGSSVFIGDNHLGMRLAVSFVY